jgi:hypothetical protein
LQQGLTPLQVAAAKQKISIVRLLRNPPPVFERPAYSAPDVVDIIDIVDGQQQQQHPFKNFEGLQRYSEEAAR